VHEGRRWAVVSGREGAGESFTWREEEGVR